MSHATCYPLENVTIFYNYNLYLGFQSSIMFIVYTLSKDAIDGLSRASTLSKQSRYKIVHSKKKDLLGNLY